MRLSAGSMHSLIPAGKSGNADIVHDSPSPLTRIRASMDGMPLRHDTYTRLIINGKVWMTDAEYEWKTNLIPVHMMGGDVLIAGLGIGFILPPLLDRDSVRSITIIEKSSDVIDLVGKHFTHPKVEIIHADAFEWTPPKRSYDAIYFDIWADVPNEDDKPQIAVLRKRYRSSLRKGGWMTYWTGPKPKNSI